MTLFTATLITGLVLAFLGSSILIQRNQSERVFKAFPRSSSAAAILLGLATAWFVFELWHLGEADFGNHKNKLILGFIAVSFLSYFYIPDFLAVRGLAAFLLMSADKLLDAAYMEDPQSRLFLVTFVYLMIMVCMYLGSLPYRLRDFLNWLYGSTIRSTAVAISCFIYGLLLVGVAFTY